MKYTAIIFAIAAASFVIIGWFVFGPQDGTETGTDIRVQIAELCLGVISAEKRVGFKAQLDKSGYINFDIGGSESAEGSSVPEVVVPVTECIAKGYGANASVSNEFISRIPLPLGQVANDWNDLDFNIYIEETEDAEEFKTLNNLRFPIAAGPMPNVLKDWCEANSLCVECSSVPPADERGFPEKATVSVSLRRTASVERSIMPGIWTNSKDVWEDVDEAGRRYLRICSK